MKMKAQRSKLMGYSKSSSKREVYSNIVLPLETRKNLKQPKLRPKATRGRTNKPKVAEGKKS